MTRKTKCPSCGHVQESGNCVGFDSDHLMSALQQCDECGEYYQDYYKVTFLGSTTHGCNMFPAPGVTEEEMYAAGVELDD